jgi:hypothetical protein
VNFARIDIRLSRVTSGVDEKLRPQFSQHLDQHSQLGIIGRTSGGHYKRDVPPNQILLNRRPNVTVSTKQQNHETPAENRIEK